MVRLKGEQDLYNIIRDIRFNSTMVRLKADAKRAMEWIFNGFNSTMVRLKVETNTEAAVQTLVSIPQWFD